MNEPELRFKADDGSEFPEWKEFKFVDLLESIVDFRGRTPKKLGMDWADHKTNHLALSAVNVKMGYIDFDNDPHYGDDALYNKWMHGRELHEGQVLFTTEAPMGNVAQVPNDEPYILSQRTIAFNPKQNLIKENFLITLLESPNVQNKLEILATGGTAQGVSQKSLSHLTVKIPCLLEQQKIADLFSTLDNVIDSVQKEVDSWEQMKRGVMQKLFNQEVRFKADDGTEFPEWEESVFADIFYGLNNNTLSRENLNNNFGTYRNVHYGDVLIKYGSILDMSRDVVPFINDNVNCDKYALLRNGDIIIADTAEDETAGKMVEIQNVGDQKVISGLHTMAWRPKEKFASMYLGYYMNSSSYHDQLHPYMQGIKVTSVSKSNIILTTIKIPCFEEQRKIADCLSEFDLVIEKTKQKLEAYKQLKKGLMQRMFV